MSWRKSHQRSACGPPNRPANGLTGAWNTRGKTWQARALAGFQYSAPWAMCGFAHASAGANPAGWSVGGDVAVPKDVSADEFTDGELSPGRGPASSESANGSDDPVLKRRRAEAVLLFSREPLPLRKLAQLAGLADATEARTLLRQLNELYDRVGSALRIEEIAGGYQILTRPGLAPWLRRFASAPPAVRLSSPAMETLAIVAYRQPVPRANIEAIRGVACGEILRQLMQRDLVRICGRSEELGRPYLYGTTKHFLQTFGLKDIQSLPTILGAGVEDDSEDTCENLSDQDQAFVGASPIEATNSLEILPTAIPSFDAVTPKESDVSTACVLDDLCDNLPRAMADSFELADASFVIPAIDPMSMSPRAADDDDDEYYDDDDEEDDDDDEEDEVDDLDEDEDWDDEEEEDEDVVDGDEDEVEDDWEEVGDEDDEESESEEDEEEDEEDEDWDEEEDEDWDDDDDDEEEEDEDEEWD